MHNTLDEYQRAAMRTANTNMPLGDRLANAGLGLAGEAGEAGGAIKKHLYHGHKLDKSALTEEMGDVLWYLAEVADALGVSLQQVAEANIAKLRTRYPDGFSEEASRERADH